MELSELALLAAFLLPVGVLAAMNLMLALAGETGTLLLPTLRDYPRVDPDGERSPIAKPVATAGCEAAAGEAELRMAA